MTWWERRLAALHTIIAEQDGVLAGFASYEDDGHLDFLFVHPAFARRGIATRLYLQVESALSAAQVTRVFTDASLAARPFFEHHGFKVDAEELIGRRGVQLRRFAMSKKFSRKKAQAILEKE
jgi:putative acetyltransferase